MNLKRVRAVDLLWNFLLGMTCLFIVAKVVGWIDWSWWVVLSPFAVPLSVAWVVFIALFVFWFVVLFYHRLHKYLKDKK